MRICYLDESGDTRELPNTKSNVTPVFVLAGVAIDQTLLENFTREFITLKIRFYPHLTAQTNHRLSRILPEIKGADLRKAMRSKAGRNKVRHTMGVLDALLRLLESHEAKIFGRVWVKVPGGTSNGRSIYTFSVQDTCATFQNYLESVGDHGVMIADSRLPSLNAAVSHSIFTKKFRTDGDAYPRLLELPTFGHSQNHAGLQVADLVCSSLLFPMAAAKYCDSHPKSVHVNPGFERVTEKFGGRVKALQHRYVDDKFKNRGGIVVSDPHTKRPSHEIFQK